jgi:hypothetical protein
MGMNVSGCERIEMDENEEERIGIAANGWKWMRMDANGSK